MRRLYAWLTGYLVILLPEWAAERFLQMCVFHKIQIHRTIRLVGEVRLQISLRDYKRIGPIARKCHVVPIICKRFGAPFLWQWVKKHLSFVLGCAVFWGILLILQQKVWLIAIEGNFVRTDEQIVRLLNEHEISIGRNMEDIDCEQVEELIRTEMPDIIWVSCEKRGAKLYIHIKEAYRYPENEQAPITEGNLIAAEDGYIETLVVRQGVPLVKTGDYVKKGDRLVSGVIRIVDAYEVESKRYFVLPEAEIVMTKQIAIEKNLKRTILIKNYQKKTRKIQSIFAFGREILKYKTSIPRDNCDIIIAYANLKLFSRVELPISVKIGYQQEYLEQEQRLEDKNALQYAGNWYLHYLEQLVMNGYELIEEQHDMELTDEEIQIKGMVTVRYPGWEYQELTEEDRALPNQTEQMEE